MPQLKRKSLRHNLRSLHPIPYLERQRREEQNREWNRICDESFRRITLEQMQKYSPPGSSSVGVFGWLLFTGIIFGVVAGYLSAR